MELRQMTPEQAYEVYHTQAFLQAFPWAERRPWRSIWALLQKNAYECYGGYDAQGALLCCAFFAKAQGAYLMDYLMTMPEHRDNGLGGRFLSQLLDGPFAERLILGEAEAPDGGPEDELRRRRLGFYRRNRFEQTDVMSWVYGVDYRIIAWNLPPATKAEALADQLMSVYEAILGPERCGQWVRVWQQETPE